MPGLGPGIHVFLFSRTKDVDGRDKPGHDGIGTSPAMTNLAQTRQGRCYQRAMSRVSPSRIKAKEQANKAERYVADVDRAIS
jgi:hypothetical protein